MKNIIISACFIATLAVGVIAGYVFGGSFKKMPLPTSCPVNASVQDVKNKLVTSGTISEYASSLSGVVSSVSGNKVSFSAPLVNLFQDEKLKNRVAIVSSKTKVYVYTLRSREDIDSGVKTAVEKNKELQTALNEKAGKLKECLSSKASEACSNELAEERSVREQISSLSEAYSVYSKREGSISDIKPGFLITVSSGKNEAANGGLAEVINIANEQEFEASYIELRESIAKKEEKK
jgi:hypothetical protein